MLVLRKNLECGKTFVQKTRKANHKEDESEEMQTKQRCRFSSRAEKYCYKRLAKKIGSLEKLCKALKTIKPTSIKAKHAFYFSN